MLVTNPYEATTSSTIDRTDSHESIETLRILRKPGLIMAIQGWILTALYGIGLLVIVLLGQRRDLFEMGIPFLACLAFAILLARCGISTARGKSKRMAYTGAILSALLFLPVGIFIFLWVVMSLNQSVAPVKIR